MCLAHAVVGASRSGTSSQLPLRDKRPHDHCDTPYHCGVLGRSNADVFDTSGPDCTTYQSRITSGTHYTDSCDLRASVKKRKCVPGVPCIRRKLQNVQPVPNKEAHSTTGDLPRVAQNCGPIGVTHTPFHQPSNPDSNIMFFEKQTPEKNLRQPYSDLRRLPYRIRIGHCPVGRWARPRRLP